MRLNSEQSCKACDAFFQQVRAGQVLLMDWDSKMFELHKLHKICVCAGGKYLWFEEEPRRED